jgi:hypothetical protein
VRRRRRRAPTQPPLSTPSRAAAPRCPSSSRGASWSSPTSATPGPFWAPRPTTAPSRPSSSPSTSSPTCHVSRCCPRALSP